MYWVIEGYANRVFVLVVGGVWGSGAFAGLGVWSGIYPASNAYAYIGGRICCEVSYDLHILDLLVENYRKECGLVGL